MRKYRNSFTTTQTLLYDFIGHFQFLRWAQGFGLVSLDPLWVGSEYETENQGL